MLIEIYTKTGCPACQKAKQLLESKGLSFQEWELGRNITRDELKSRFPTATHVPIVMVDNRQYSLDNLPQMLLEA